MRPRRLLILAYFYPPLGGGGVHRVLGFTRHLPAAGWSCTVVCAGEDDYWVKDPSLAIPEGVEVLRVSGGSALSAWLKLRGGGAAAGRRSGATFGALRRLSDWWLLPDSYAGWARRASRVAARRLARGDVDALLSSSPPDSAHLAALPLARRFGLPWFADFRDPWVGLHFRAPPTSWHRARQAALERRVVGAATTVVAASRTHVEQLSAMFPDRATRIEHLPNGMEPETSLADSSLAGDFSEFVIVFTGTLAQMPDAHTFLDALHDLLARQPQARRRVRVRFAGPYETGIEDRAIALGLKGIVEFLGPVPHASARALQRRADLLLLWKPHGPGYRTMVPGKLYEYLEAGRPIVALLDPEDEAARLAAQGGAMLLAPGPRGPLTAVLEEAYTSWQKNGRTSDREHPWLAQHARAALSQRLAQLLDRECTPVHQRSE